MTEFLVAALMLGGALALAIWLGRSQGRAESDEDLDRAGAERVVAEYRAELERQALERHRSAGIVAQEIRDAAPVALAPDARMDAADQWVRENADRVSAGGGDVDATAVRDRKATGPDGKPDA